MSAPIRVLVVDDSAFARKVVRQILQSSPGIEVVGTARDGLDALEKIATLSPDVITVDLVMPHLDGIGLLAALPSASAPRAVVVTSADENSEQVVAALQAGAVAAVRKPTALATERLYDIATELVRAVIQAAEATTVPPAPRGLRAPVNVLGDGALRRRLVVIGASTGGPSAVTRLLTALPATFPAPIALVVHMPVGYTEAFARRLDEQCALEVVEASDGMRVCPGRVVVGRAGLHLTVRAVGAELVARLEALPLDPPHRPSVDVLFSSAAAALGADVLGAVLTGMGDDGLAGSRAVVAAGGAVITQSAETCVVYGMPRSVAEAGLSAEAVALEQLPEALGRHLVRAAGPPERGLRTSR